MFVADLINGRIRRIEGAKPDLLTAMHGGPFTEGTDGTLRVTETNNGVGWLTGPVTATITLPTALTFKAASGDGWTCDAHGQTVTCTNPANMAPGAASSLDITVGVASGAPRTVDVAAMSSSDSDVVDPAHQVSVLGIEITAPILRLHRPLRCRPPLRPISTCPPARPREPSR